MSPPARRPTPKIAHSRIVEAQQDLLKWCPNAANVSKEDLEYTCWACGSHSKQSRMTRCHIEPFEKGEIEDPTNFVLLCDVCHREQPDALSKEVLKYWLCTREPELQRYHRLEKIFAEVLNMMRDDFGEVLVNAAIAAWLPPEEAETATINQNFLRYTERSAGQGRGNTFANGLWGPLQGIHDWCERKKQAVGEMQRELERWVDSARDGENQRPAMKRNSEA